MLVYLLKSFLRFLFFDVRLLSQLVFLLLPLGLLFLVLLLVLLLPFKTVWGDWTVGRELAGLLVSLLVRNEGHWGLAWLLADELLRVLLSAHLVNLSLSWLWCWNYGRLGSSHRGLRSLSLRPLLLWVEDVLFVEHGVREFIVEDGL